MGKRVQVFIRLTLIFLGTVNSPCVFALPGNTELSLILPDLRRVAPQISEQILTLALRSASCAKARGDYNSSYLAIIDYSLPSARKRFWLHDLDKRRLLHEELIANGKESGVERAERFSNVPGSLQSSLGLFQTGGTYFGQHGYSMYLHGLEKGFNDHAYERAIVMHGASYVSEDIAERWQRVGRSWGCPAVSLKVVQQIIDYLKDEALLFSYYPDERWLKQSKFLNGCKE